MQILRCAQDDHSGSGSSGVGHLLTGLGAAAAEVSAPPQGLVLAGDPLTLLRALTTNLGTDGAGADVIRRSAQHEVGAGGADLRTIEQQADMTGFGVLAPQLEAMVRGFHSETVAV